MGLMETINFYPVDDPEKTKLPDGGALLDIPELHPVPASKVMPEWWNKLNTYQNQGLEGAENTPFKRIEFESATAKACRPMAEFLLSGYIIPLWCEYMFKRDPAAGWIFSSTRWSTDGHRGEQLGDGLKSQKLFQKGHVVKFMNPWQIVTPPGYSCLFIKPFYHFEDRFEIMPAIVNTDLFDATVNFPALVRSENCRDQFVLEMGYPLVLVIPVKRTDWRSVIQAVPHEVEKKARVFKYRMKNALNLIYHRFCKANIIYK